MKKISRLHERFMRRAIRLAKKGRGRVYPNPLVGAVVVENGRIVGEGAHLRFGGPHAEIHAIWSAGKKAAGATLYVSLEPCSHFGKTPACADFIIRSGIRQVVIGAKDPNPLVAGRGIRKLRKAGLKVITGILEKEAKALDPDFFRRIRRARPRVIVKAAQSLDGKIATSTGQSRWISGEPARRFAQRLRAAQDAILVGVHTVLRDDPLLSVRIGQKSRQPVKIILDSRLRTPLRARIFSSASPGPVILAVTRKAPLSRFKLYQAKAEIVVAKEENGRVELRSLFSLLRKRGIVRILVEGGGETIESVLRAGLADEICLITSPLLIGGKNTPSSVGGKGIARLNAATKIKNLTLRRLGRDFVFHGVF